MDKNTDIPNKKEFRKAALIKRSKLTPEERAIKSKQIFRNLLELESFKKAKTVMVYMDFGSEVFTDPIIEYMLENGIRPVVPICQSETRTLKLSEIKDLKNDCQIGFYNIREPKEEFIRHVDVSDIDFVIVPGVAFSPDRFRLGYGGGYYDRFIETLREDAVTCAVAFEEQIYEKVPVQSHDKQIDFIVTDKRVI